MYGRVTATDCEVVFTAQSFSKQTLLSLANFSMALFLFFEEDLNVVQVFGCCLSDGRDVTLCPVLINFGNGFEKFRGEYVAELILIIHFIFLYEPSQNFISLK